MQRIWTIGFVMIGSLLWGAPLCEDSSSPHSPCAGWKSLQQLRTVIPERVWQQEFAIRIKDSAGEKDCDYFLRSTLAGENVRLLDRYQEFQTSPFWNTPPMLEKQADLEKELLAKTHKGKADGAKLGAIRFEGNRFFAGSALVSYIRTRPGEPIVLKELAQDMAWMNQNPFRKTDVLLVPGVESGTTDLELVTTDRWPYRVYTGADNTGTISTERNRLIFGFDFGKTVIQDSQVAYQFTCSPNWNHFFSHALSARVPCPWRHVAVFYGGYSEVKPELSAPGEKERGISWQVDGRYRIPIQTNTCLMQEFVVGYDFKQTSNRVKEHGKTERNDIADINQFMVGYELGYQVEEQKVTFSLELYGNPGGITTQNHSKNYHKFFRGANAQYGYAKFTHGFAKKLPQGWWFTYDLSGQIASTHLLPSEQFVLTGYNAVRGFEERILMVDQAALANISIETPHMHPVSWFTKTKCHEDDFYLLAFFDCAAGAQHSQGGCKTLASAGPGVRYQWSRYITARFDYGFQLWHAGFEHLSHSRYNFGMIVSY